MIIFKRQKNRIRGVAYVVNGAGLFDWLGNAASKVGNFINNNSSLIKGIASTIADVGKAGASTATSVKQIVDLARQNRALKAVPQMTHMREAITSTPIVVPHVLPVPPVTYVPPVLQNALNQKSVDILNKLMKPMPSTAAGAGLYLGRH